MAVEEDAGARVHELQEGDAGAELVDEEGVGGEGVQLGGEEDLDDEVELSQDGA